MSRLTGRRADFVWDDGHPIDHPHFHRVLAGFVAHVYAQGLPCRRRLSPSQARDEAVALLEYGYKGTCENGYFAAVLDAGRAQPNGVEVVLVQLGEAIKAGWRQMHVRWVFAKFLDPSDWPLCCEIASVLLERLRICLPEEISHWQPAQFVDEIPELLMQFVTMDSQLRQVSCGPISFMT